MKKSLSSQQPTTNRRALFATLVMSFGFLGITYLLFNTEWQFIGYVTGFWGLMGIAYGVAEIYKAL